MCISADMCHRVVRFLKRESCIAATLGSLNQGLSGFQEEAGSVAFAVWRT